MLRAMRNRDYWYGAVLVTDLVTLGARLGGVATPLLGSVAVLTAGALAWDVCRDRGWLGLRRPPSDLTTVASNLPGPGQRTTVGLAFGDVGMQAPMMSPSAPAGDLPIRVDMHGLVGGRDGDLRSTRWVWEVEDCAIASRVDEPLFFKVWLKIPVARQIGATELEASDGLVRLDPRGHVRRSFEFEQRQFRVESPAEKHPPGPGPMELWFLEVGTQRTWRVTFQPAQWGPTQSNSPTISSVDQT